MVKPDGDLFSCDKMAIKYKMTPYNHFPIKYVKLISAIPMIWLNENCTLSASSNFNEFKEKVLTQIELSNKSNRTVFAFLREKSKVFPIKQQLKWCESLQTSFNFMNWKKIYENNYFSTIETKLRSFQIWLNLRSVVTNVQLADLILLIVKCARFVYNTLKQSIICFWTAKL